MQLRSWSLHLRWSRCLNKKFLAGCTPMFASCCTAPSPCMVKSCYLFLNTCWSANAGVRSDGLGLGKQPVPAGRCDFHRMLPQGGNLLCLMLGRDFTLPGMAGTFFFLLSMQFQCSRNTGIVSHSYQLHRLFSRQKGRKLQVPVGLGLHHSRKFSLVFANVWSGDYKSGLSGAVHAHEMSLMPYSFPLQAHTCII